MEELPNRITRTDLAGVMRKSFLDYAMSVIVARALPDVRDGLKPVHRRILYGMHEQGVTPDKPHLKSARIVGNVMGKYHPHGDSAIYESMVRMAQPFSYRYMLVDGHGNFGSVDGDGAAAMRYTEARMSKIALEMLRDINKDTIDFQDNYDGRDKEPVVLPARFPNLLVNGATGIAVGMTTNIPPHNLKEVISGLHMLMKDPDVTTKDLMKAIPGPDFPTGGVVMGKAGVMHAYETGKGTITVRAKIAIEKAKSGREQIIVTELPYMVNKANLVQRIAELAREKKIEGITDVKDESDREGMRITIDVRRDVSASVVLNNLYKLTLLQTTFSFHMLAIDHGTPKLMSLKTILQAYLKHQEEVIRRRTQYDLKKAKARAHILEGLHIALDHIDAIISIIRNSQSASVAKDRLMNEYHLSDKQAQAILDMRLVRLTGLERQKVEDELAKTKQAIAEYEAILASPQRINEIIYDELLEIQRKFGDDRRTELQAGGVSDIEDEDLIEEETVMVSLTHNDYVKRAPVTDFRAQNRGGRGMQGMGIHDDDFVEQLIVTSTHDELFYFTNQGRVFKQKAYKIPEYGRTAKGIPAINLLRMQDGEKVKAILNASRQIRQNHGDTYLFFVTKFGYVKRVRLEEFANIRQTGLKTVTLREGDEVINVFVTNGHQNIIVGTRNGYAACFAENEVRTMGRNAAGVRSINLREDDYVVGAAVLKEGGKILTVTEKGFGKQTPTAEYAIKRRGVKGVKTAALSAKTGLLAGLLLVDDADDVVLTTDKGVMIRINAATVSTSQRLTTGVRLIRLDADSKVAALAKITPAEPDDAENDAEAASTAAPQQDATDDVNRLLDAATKSDDTEK